MGPSLPQPAGKAVGVIALVFFTGLATGYLGSDLLESMRSEPDTAFRMESTLQDLAEQLDLNPSQMEQVREILDDVIMEEAELLSELRANQMEARKRIAQFLTPAQNREFDELILALEAR